MRLGEFPHVKFRVHRISAEAAERMDDENVEWTVGTLGRVDHLLEYRPVLVEGGRARLREYLNDLPSLPLAVQPALRDLIGQRQIMVSLTCSRDSNVDRRA